MTESDRKIYDELFQNKYITSRLDVVRIIDRQIEIIQAASESSPHGDLAMLSDSLCRLAELRLNVMYHNR